MGKTVDAAGQRASETRRVMSRISGELLKNTSCHSPFKIVAEDAPQADEDGPRDKHGDGASGILAAALSGQRDEM